MLRVLCCGSRSWDNQEIIDDVLSELPENSIIMHCKSKGADTMAAAAAKRLGFKVEAFEDIDSSDESDTPTRAIKMLSHHPDLIIAFHGNIADSIGTKHIMRVARSMHIPLKLVTNSRNPVSSKTSNIQTDYIQATNTQTATIHTTNMHTPTIHANNIHTTNMQTSNTQTPDIHNEFLSRAAATTWK